MKNKKKIESLLNSPILYNQELGVILALKANWTKLDIYNYIIQYQKNIDSWRNIKNGSCIFTYTDAAGKVSIKERKRLTKTFLNIVIFLQIKIVNGFIKEIEYSEAIFSKVCEQIEEIKKAAYI